MKLVHASLLLLLVPMALAGDFAKMWAEVEEELKMKMKAKQEADMEYMNGGMGGMGGNMGMEKQQEQKGWMDMFSGWGEESKSQGWGEESKPKGWGEESKPKGWGEESKPKGWGEESKPKGWGEESKPKGWGDMMMGWGEEKKDEEGPGMETEFKKWMEEQKSQQKEQEEYKMYMKGQVMKFHEFMKMKEMKMKEEDDAKMAIKKQMEQVKMKEMLNEQMYELSKSLMKQKAKFMKEVISHLLESCQCENSRAVWDRIQRGEFGGMAMAGMGGGNMMGGNRTFGDMMNSNMTDVGMMMQNLTLGDLGEMTSPEQKMKLVSWFAKLDPEEQSKQVHADLTKVLCRASSKFFDMLKELEAAVVEHKKNKIDNGGMY